ncbi:MAG: YafY family transcriptional regulator [Anaerolineae bacterium]|nr:YafY family transcriptional regulator [Anaerolineae bacterium]
MTNVATRLLSLILLLQSKPLWKAGALAEELNVSERTVHRYMEMLEEMGIPIYTERGPYGGFALLRGYKLPPLVFTAEEATVLYMGANLMEEVWGQVYKDAVTSVTAKLDNVLPDDLRQEVSLAQQSLVVSGLLAKDYRPWAPVMHTLRECIASRRAVRLTYRSFSLEETCRDVDPYALTFRGGLWYAVGYCHLRHDMRTFRIDRIQDVVPLHARFTIPSNFSAREYIQSAMRFEDKYTIAVHMKANIAPIIREHIGHWANLTEHDDGSVTVRFGVSGLDWATGWVLSYGRAAKVLEPPELVERVKTESEAIAARYKELTTDIENT